MGLPFISSKRSRKDPHLMGSDSVAERFDAYFARVFAYARSCAGGDVPAQDIVVQAFCRAFQRAGNSDDERFFRVLFRSARVLCQPALKAHTATEDPGLDRREREVLSLVFDARLRRDQIAAIFRIRASTVSALLASGLSKLKQQTPRFHEASGQQPA